MSLFDALARHLTEMRGRSASSEKIAQWLSEFVRGGCLTFGLLAGPEKTLAAVALLCEGLERSRQRWEQAALAGSVVAEVLSSAESAREQESESESESEEWRGQ